MASEISSDTIVLPNADYIHTIHTIHTIPVSTSNTPATSEPLLSTSYMTKLFSVTDELCIFMNLPTNTKVSVKNAVEYVMNYIKKNGLSSPDDRTKIHFNDELSDLFNLQNKNGNGKTETFISYFDIHELIYFHFLNI